MKQKTLFVTKGFLHLLNFLTLGVFGGITSLLLLPISLVIGLCGLLLGLCAYALSRGFSFCLSSRNFFYFAFDFLTDEFLFRYVGGLLGFIITGGLLSPFRYVK